VWKNHKFEHDDTRTNKFISLQFEVTDTGPALGFSVPSRLKSNHSTTSSSVQHGFRLQTGLIMNFVHDGTSMAFNISFIQRDKSLERSLSYILPIFILVPFSFWRSLCFSYCKGASPSQWILP